MLIEAIPVCVHDGLAWAGLRNARFGSLPFGNAVGETSSVRGCVTGPRLAADELKAGERRGHDLAGMSVRISGNSPAAWRRAASSSSVVGQSTAVLVTGRS